MRLATETRNRAYVEVLDTLADKQQAVYDVLCRSGQKDMTNREIKEALGWEINCVTGRVFELRTLGIVEPSVKRLCRYGRRPAQSWRARPPTAQASLFTNQK